MTERHLRTMKIDSHLSPPPSMGRIVKSYLPSPLGGEGQGEG